MELSAVRIGALAHNLAAEFDGPVRLLAVFERHVYLRAGTDALSFVLILSPREEAAGPLTIGVDTWPDWTRQPRAAGVLRGGRMTLKDVGIDLSTAAVGPAGTPGLRHHDIHALLEPVFAIAGGLEHNSSLLKTVLADRHRAAPPNYDLMLLRAGLETSDETTIRRGARAIAGLGPGLTPSGDDFLCGAMTALWTFGAQPEAPCSTILSAVEGHTTTLSLAFLRAAGTGHVTDAWRGLLLLLASASVEPRLPTMIEAVTRPGFTSGADTLAGFLWAGTLLHAKAVRERR